MPRRPRFVRLRMGSLGFLPRGGSVIGKALGEGLSEIQDRHRMGRALEGRFSVDAGPRIADDVLAEGRKPAREITAKADGECHAGEGMAEDRWRSPRL